MPPTDDERLVHMLEFSREAIALIAGKSTHDVISDRVLSLAVTHLVETIGEAASGISASRKASLSEIPWRRVIGTRNRITHGYTNIDMKVVDSIIRDDLPALVSTLERILNQ